jgi:hypothetical protein
LIFALPWSGEGNESVVVVVGFGICVMKTKRDQTGDIQEDQSQSGYDHREEWLTVSRRRIARKRKQNDHNSDKTTSLF